MLSLFTKKDPLNKDIYRPVNLQPHMFKIFVRFLYKNIETFMGNKVSTKLFGFRKNLNT